MAPTLLSSGARLTNSSATMAYRMTINNTVMITQAVRGRFALAGVDKCFHRKY